MSTVELVEPFMKLGFGVLSGELAALKPVRYAARTPIEVLPRAVAVDDPPANANIRAELSHATLGQWRDFPDVLPRAVRLYRDPILTTDGSLTEMRN